MEREPSDYGNFEENSSQSEDAEWRVWRVDIRSPLSQLPGHIARVELEHVGRGRVTEIGSSRDIMGAAISACARILGSDARVLSLHSCHRSHTADVDGDRALASIVIECDGRKRRGTASGHDLIFACLSAFIAAVTSAENRDCSLLGAGLNVDKDVDLLAARPCQSSGIDENGDWWLFASDDAGAAEAIAAEFTDEGYTQVRLSLPHR